MWIALAVLIILAGVAFMVQPFFRSARAVPGRGSLGADARRALQAEKEAVYAALKDLDFEYQTGKLSDQDYGDLRESYRARALSILSASDRLKAAAPAAEPDGAARCPRCAHGNPPGSKFCEACGAPLAAESACPACGIGVAAEDRFCAECGAPVGGGAAAHAGAIPAWQGGKRHDRQRGE